MYKCLLILGSPTNSTQSHFSSHKAVCVFVCVCLCDYHKQCSALCMGACFLPISSLLFTCGNVLFSWLEPKPVPIESSSEIHLVNVLNGHQELKRIRLHHLNLPGRHMIDPDSAEGKANFTSVRHRVWATVVELSGRVVLTESNATFKNHITSQLSRIF